MLENENEMWLVTTFANIHNVNSINYVAFYNINVHCSNKFAGLMLIGIGEINVSDSIINFIIFPIIQNIMTFTSTNLPKVNCL